METIQLEKKHSSLATLKQISHETQIPLSWFYERSRTGDLPGMRRLGKHIRIDRDDFFSALREKHIR